MLRPLIEVEILVNMSRKVRPIINESSTAEPEEIESS
jgi:hypothetical protein